MNFPPDEEEAYLPLHIAVSNRDVVDLTNLLGQSQDSINSRDPWNHTPLQIAVQNNDLPAVQLLLSYGADSGLQVPDDYCDLIDSTNSLSLAASCGHVEVLRLLMENSGHLTSKALYMAAESGRLECVADVLSWIAKKEGVVFDDAVAKSEAVGEALRIAAAGWRSDIVEVILRIREIETRFLDNALWCSIWDEDELDDFHVTNPVPRKTLDGKEKRINTVRLLLDAGADVNVKGQLHGIQGMTPLHQTARMGNRVKEIFDLLLENGPDINSEDEAGQTPLFQMVLVGDVYFAEKLIEKGASVNHPDKAGCTALHVSTSNLTLACKPIITLLLDHGAQISALTQQRETSLHLAAHGNAAAIEFLLPLSDPPMIAYKSTSGFTALHFAADGQRAQQCIDVVNLLLSKGVNINECTNDSYTLLHHAVTCYTLNKIDFISFLLEKAADVNGCTIMEISSHSTLRPDGTSTSVKSEMLGKEVIDTPLHLAMDGERADFNIMYLLLDKGASIEARDNARRTALLRCVMGYEVTPLRLEIAKELLRRGADVEAMDNLGRKVDVDVWCT